MIPSTMKRFELTFIRQLQTHPLNLVPHRTTCDPLSQALSHLSQRDGLLEFIFEGSADTSITWPPSFPSTDWPYWPTIRIYGLSMLPIMPPMPVPPHDGSAPGDRPENELRAQIGLDTIIEIFIKASKCAGQMPQIGELDIDILDEPVNMYLGFNKAVPEELPCLEFNRDPVPSQCEAIVEVFREIAEKRGHKFHLDVLYDTGNIL